MAFTLEKQQGEPATYIKLFKGNFILAVDSGSVNSYKYSTNRGGTWFVVSDKSGKIQINNSYLYVEDGTDLSVFQMPPNVKVINY